MYRFVNKSNVLAMIKRVVCMGYNTPYTAHFVIDYRPDRQVSSCVKGCKKAQSCENFIEAPSLH